jgi:K+-sensing histidine kinase KdpD
LNPLLLFFGAVVVTGWYGGLGPSLVTTVLSVLLQDSYFIEPYYTLDLNLTDFAALLIFVMLALVLSSLTTARRQAEDVLQASNARLRRPPPRPRRPVAAPTPPTRPRAPFRSTCPTCCARC